MNRINQLLTKVCLLLTLVVFSFGVAYSATYYISNGGNDSNTGLTTSQAWKSLAKVNSWSFKPGDQILFQCGSSFYGSLTVKNLGTATNPITYGSYGTGSNPMITGFTAVASWENLGNNIWESTSSVSTLSNCKMVLIDGAVVPMGRYPNYNSTDGGFLTFQSSTTTSITSSSLSGTPDWTGAEVVIRSKRWVLAKRAISSQSSGTLNFTTSTTVIGDCNGFFIQNDVRTLDQQNEWYYNPTTKKIRIYSTYQPQNVKVASVENLVVFDKLSYNYSLAAHITIKNIDFVGSNGDLIYTQPSLVAGHRLHHVNISNCNLSYAGYNAIRAGGDYMTMENNTFSDINGSGILNVGGRRIHLIRNNTFTNISMVYGQGNPDYTDMAISYSTFTSATIEGNRITNCGFNGISFNADSTVIVRNNYIENYNLRLDDGGAITTGGPNSYGCKIDGNICLNGGYGNALKGTTGTYSQSVGIYLDDNCSNVEVSNNTIANCYWVGIYLHNANTNNIHHNTVFNCRGAQIRTADDVLGGDIYANTIQNNFFIAKQSTQTCANFSSNQNNLTTIGTLNGNIYSRPIDDNKTITIYQPSTGSLSKTLSEWKTFSSQDANSLKSPVAVKSQDEIKLEYNDSKEIKSVTIEQPMVDVKGAKYYGKYTLQPYTSVVLLKVAQTPVPTTEYKTICEGSSYNGWTTSGKYELKTVDAKGNYSLVTVNLTVTPVSKLTETITINEGENYKGWTQSGTYTRKLTAVSGCDSLVTTNLVVIKLINKQGEVLPTHYTPAGLNSTGQNPMTLRIEGAELEDSPLTTGDEIAVFSGTTCVGAIRLSHPIQATDASSVATVSVYPRTSTYSGFVSNDTIVFKIWSAQQQKEFTINRVNYKNDLAAWATTGKFSAGSAAVVELFSYTELTQTIYLKQGYNLISAYVAPANADAAQVLKSLAASGNLSKVQNEAGNAYENWETAGGWVNSIGSIEETEGYKVKVSADCSLKITGRPVALPLDIPLVEGWNLISYPRIDEVNAMSIIQSLIDENKLVKVQDENGSAIENWQSFGGWINGIGNFIPGKAYKVKVNASAVLHIDENYLKSSVLLAQSALPEHFLKVTEGNGIDHMNINLSGLNESGLQAGDELAAFDGGVCVGSIKITEAQLDNGLAVIAASYKTDLAVKDGFTEGNVLQLKVWKQQGNSESVVGVVCTAGRLVYERNASVFVQLKSGALTTAVTSLGMQAGWNVFPNPSDGAFTVKFDQMPEEGSRIDILDLSGKKITSRVVSWNAEDFNLAGQAPGVYLVKSTHGSNELIRKLIIN